MYNFNIMSYLLYALPAVLLLILIGWIVYLEARLKKFFRGSKGADLESVLVSIKDNLSKLDRNDAEQSQQLQTIDKKIKRSIQHVKTLRFNPFGDSGSNQSFAVALLNEDGDGVALSSLYSRDKVGIYAKPIEKYQSEYSLSDEEREVVKQIKENG